jgi:hypothetical protein
VSGAKDLTTHLAEHPGSAELLAAVRRAVAAVGPAAERTTRSQVAFRRGTRTVAAAWAPAQYLGHGAPLVLSVVLHRRDRSPRWKEVVEPRPGRFMHHLEVHGPDDLDAEVQGWLAEAWRLAGEDAG